MKNQLKLSRKIKARPAALLRLKTNRPEKPPAEGAALLAWHRLANFGEAGVDRHSM